MIFKMLYFVVVPNNYALQNRKFTITTEACKGCFSKRSVTEQHQNKGLCSGYWILLVKLPDPHHLSIQLPNLD